MWTPSWTSSAAITQKRSFRVLRRGGKLISAVSHPDPDLAKSRGVDASFFLVKVASQSLARIADLIDSGKLRTRVGTVLPLADAREEHFILESLLFAEQGNNFLLKNAGKLRRTIGLELNPDVASVHSNLPAWTVTGGEYSGLLEEFQVNRGVNPMP